MKALLRNLALSGLLAFSGLLGAVPAYAAANGSAVMCWPDVTVGPSGARTIGGTGSQVPSGTLYVLNSSGCALVQQADIGWFQSQGGTFAGDGGVIIWSAPVAATGTTSYQLGTLPPGAYIKAILVQDSDAAHAVTGGIQCGVSSADTTIVSTAQTVGLTTSSVGSVTDAHILLRNFSTTASQPIWCQAVTSWNTPTTVTITIPYGYF